MSEGPSPGRSAVRLEFAFDDSFPFGDGVMQAAAALAGSRPRPAGAGTGAASARRRPSVQTIDGALTAQAVLEQFRQHRSAWYAPHLAPFVEGIERQLEHEARLSERLGGLPATDHPSLWWDAASEAAARTGRPGSRPAAEGQLAPRLKLWQPPVWWIAPIVRRPREGEAVAARPLNMRLPLADTAAELVRELAEQVPPAWRRRRVVVQLEVETRLYWGGCAPPGDAPADAEVPWQPCSFRGDGIGYSEDLLCLQGERAQWLTPAQAAHEPTIRRSLRAGVGLLVAVPLLSFEVQETRWGWIKRQALRVLRRWGLKKTVADRDPTFARRLADDERYWSAALAQPAPGDDELRHIDKRGMLLAPASGPAAAHRPQAAGEEGAAHVVLIHGGLSSVRGGFGAWLRAPGPAEVGRPWNEQMPLFNERPVWRFEHDTFLRVARNVDQLVDALEWRVIGRQPRGTLVLLAHSRGGNVARFALERLRRRWPGWRCYALTAGSPHEGTGVFRSIGRRWGGAALLVGWFREAVSGVLSKQQMVDLLILERALAYDIPPGFRDVEPEGVARMARGRPLPEGLWVWGSEWGPGLDRPVEDGLWHRIVEDWAGFEADGDGIVPKRSAMAGLAEAADASPVFHTGYFEHPPTVAQIRERLSALLGA